MITLLTAMELIKYLLPSTFMIAAHCQLQLLDRSEIEDGGRFNFTCDVGRIGTVPAAITEILFISIERTLLKEAQANTIAVYAPSYSIEVNKTIPNGRKWSVETSGSKDRASISLTLQVPDAQCSDAGVYRCNATFFPVNTVSTVGRSQNLTIKSKTTMPEITSDLHNGSDLHYSSNKVGQNITLSCTVLGPKNLVLKWRYQATIDINLTDYPFSNGIKVFHPSIVDPACDQYSHKSELSFQVQSQETVYVCAVQDGNNQVSETNFTIGIQTETTTEPNSGTSKEPSGANVGALVGSVIGGLGFIAIIAIAYFCLNRKKNDEDSENDNEIGASETAHAPPPVIYAVPKKVKKDGRDGVRQRFHQRSTGQFL